MSRHCWMTTAVCIMLLLSACTTFSPDGGLADVSTLTKERIGQALKRVGGAADQGKLDPTITQLLNEPLTAESAMQIALWNNQALQASLDELGIAEADFVQSGRLHNPGFSFGNMRGVGGNQIDRGLMFDLVGLLTLPARSKIAGQGFEQSKLRVAADAVRLAADTRRAYFNAVAAKQAMQFIERVNVSAQAGAELAQRMAKVGNISQLETMRQEVFYADAKAQLARAQHYALTQREHLARLLGMDDSTFTLPDHLPDLPPQPQPMADSERLAMQQRLDIQRAKRDMQTTADALSLTRATGFTNVLDLGYHDMNTNDHPRIGGYEISLEIPLFDWGDAKTKRAESIYMAALHRTADTAIRARSEVRVAFSAYRTSYDLALQYRDEIVPMRKRIADEVALRYNSMLTGVFELLADTREQAQSVKAAIEAQRDFWLADNELQMAINGDGTTGGERGNAAAEMK
jgi:outer membrane protein TolC